MNQINPKKLLNSKWTAVNSANKEKHFIVTKIEIDEQDTVTSCVIESVISNRMTSICWKNLKDQHLWVHGWT